jgi:hypothetical protein
MRSAFDPTGYQVPRTKTTCLLHTWRPYRHRPFALILHQHQHQHQHQSSHNLHLQYLAKSQSTQCYQLLITPGSDHPPVLEADRLSLEHSIFKQMLTCGTLPNFTMSWNTLFLNNACMWDQRWYMTLLRSIWLRKTILEQGMLSYSTNRYDDSFLSLNLLGSKIL